MFGYYGWNVLIQKWQKESEGQPLLFVLGPLDREQLLDLASFGVGLGKSEGM